MGNLYAHDGIRRCGMNVSETVLSSSEKSTESEDVMLLSLQADHFRLRPNPQLAMTVIVIYRRRFQFIKGNRKKNKTHSEHSSAK